MAAWADDYPRYTGFVNDFANQLPLSTVQELEKRVRDYERATGNEIAVAVVPSLNGMTVEEYALGLFRSWGVGKYGVNNGVLVLWAPKERKVRVEVGRGLEGVLTNAVAGQIALRITGYFRRNQFAEGLNAGVDGIIETLGTTGSAGSGLNFVDRNSPAEMERQRAEAAQRQRAEEEARADSQRTTMIVLGVVAAAIVALIVLYRRKRAAQWREELSHGFTDAAKALGGVEPKLADARGALAELRKEAPEQVWREYEATVSDAPNRLATARSDLDKMRLMPQGTYAELHAGHDALKRWHVRLDSTTLSLAQVAGMVETFRSRRAEAQVMLGTVPPALVSMQAQGVPVGCDGLLQAAGDTYDQAKQESLKTPANWLLVYDLLSDVTGCMEQIENPSRRRYQQVRYWGGYDGSPAQDAMAAMWMASEASESSQSSSGGWSDSGGSSGGSDFSSGGDSGGFGGGDSGGGGGGSDY